ncbi:hypothetical protein PENNAL_c0952G01983 [Penicillium nalgiovense]|uniref:Uncharacterized protein n=2 Tax=Penicillium TaxID=5073 RepID=A0A9W4K072_9EURO|nr:hypothetical protein PENNAL_c0952G01983 [Penicillium nalgiovense]CAG7947806.1 unnamed protein product [Penicillium salamii]CAG8273020.1 unnamed protein product [Penicillium salamii]CAG8429049.1 unnamed protein product [Penicillium salamii]CAG8431801.1 unnamed protein product [Penicillium salamii]
MDSQNSSPEQGKEGKQQPSALPILSDDDSQDNPDNAPPLPSPSRQEEETRHTLATEPLQPVLKLLADLERDDPKFAFQAARLVGLYRRLWESCVSKHIDGQKLQQGNQILKEAGAHLVEEKDGLQLCHEKQLSLLRFFEQALESSRERMTRVLDGWNHPSRLNLAGTQDIANEG